MSAAWAGNKIYNIHFELHEITIIHICVIVCRLLNWLSRTGASETNDENKTTNKRFLCWFKFHINYDRLISSAAAVVSTARVRFANGCTVESHIDCHCLWDFHAQPINCTHKSRKKPNAFFSVRKKAETLVPPPPLKPLPPATATATSNPSNNNAIVIGFEHLMNKLKIMKSAKQYCEQNSNHINK